MTLQLKNFKEIPKLLVFGAVTKYYDLLMAKETNKVASKVFSTITKKHNIWYIYECISFVLNTSLRKNI